MAALICSEAAAEAADTGQQLFVAALDTGKAFDTVSYTLLKRKLYDISNGPAIWTIESSLLDGLPAKVRCKSALSQPFPIHQGVGQGKVLSPVQYKMYIDDLLHNLPTLGPEPGWAA